MHRDEAALSSTPSLHLLLSRSFTAEAVHSVLLTFGNDAVHKAHGEAEEDEVVQMVHLCDRSTLFNEDSCATVGAQLQCECDCDPPAS